MTDRRLQGEVEELEPSGEADRSPPRATREAGDELPWIDDRVSRAWVVLIVAIFSLILLYGILFGQGGFLTPAPSPSPSPVATQSPATSPSPAASPSGTGSPSPAASPSGTGSTSPAASPSPAASASPPAAPSPAVSPGAGSPSPAGT